MSWEDQHFIIWHVWNETQKSTFLQIGPLNQPRKGNHILKLETILKFDHTSHYAYANPWVLVSNYYFTAQYLMGQTTPIFVLARQICYNANKNIAADI